MLFRSVRPRYDQVKLDEASLKNNLVPVIGSYEKPAQTWIYQNVLFSLGVLDKGVSITYNKISANNGVYLFVIEGEVQIEEDILKKRDGIAISEKENILISASENARILVMDTPLLK